MEQTRKENLLQKHMGEMMRDFHAFLEAHDIPYYLWAGTLLGAVRHKGFIPWDDDFDIAMLREDFNRLLEIADQIPEPYRLCCAGRPGIHENFPYFFAKLEDTRTRLVENNIRHLGVPGGLYIDVFVLDAIPDAPLQQKLHKMQLGFWMAIRKLLLMDAKKPRSIFKQIPVVAAQKLFSLQKVLKQAEKVARKYEHAPVRRVSSLAEMYDSAQPEYDRDLLKGRILGAFEDYQFCIPEQYHEILTITFGNYMQLPPEDQRVGAHNYELTMADGSEFR